ncbi:conserved hypothetical protein [Vibrio nigripulchritudo FTn2]|uniref:hypothetical protein n=1 Tax=Vibrio nigripulchritudo TaxID=28173 RepID=UPI0003B1EDD9|nr:hypothetical protein [Vibrio nigripulchritudo]CCN40367.1 conserved hypothetical protein [Vibrio nigripulchritudo FTn2]
MLKTIDLLDKLRVEKQLHSDREVSRFLNLSHSSVQKWRHGGTMSDEMAAEIAEILELDVEMILLGIIAERSKDKVFAKKIKILVDKKSAA